MNPWPFVITAYALTLGATLVLSVAGMIGMRRAERRADDVAKRP